MAIAITAAALLTPQESVERPVLVLDGQVVREVFSRGNREIPQNCKVIDFGDDVLAPGFIDIHIHGGGGHDVMESDPEALPAVEALIAKHGVCSYFPTTVTAPLEGTLRSLDQLARAIETGNESRSAVGARPLGIHLEGPFISHDRRGVHPPADLLPPTMSAFERFWEAARGQIRLMTIAPELPGALEVIAAAAARGICVSLGHSDADYETTRAAIDAGASHATHTFNAMRPLSHRDPGIVGAVLTDDRVSADIIADGIHLDPAIVKLFLQSKGPDKAVLISDATAATGMPDGRYRLGALEVEVNDGKCLSNGRLAGSVLTLDRAVRNGMQFAEWSLSAMVRAVTINPARITKAQRVGVLQTGSRADFVVLNRAGDVKRTVIGGKGL